MPYFTVEYYASSYKGKMGVNADDSEEAKAKVKAIVRKKMVMPMYADGYKVINEQTEDTDNKQGLNL